MKILLSMTTPSPFQVRSLIDGQQLSELKTSMKEAGQAVPIKVRQMKTGYEVVYGHRRVEAAKQLGWDEVDAIVAKLTDEQAMIQGLAENVQRDDLEPMDEAKAYKRLQDEFSWSIRRIAAEIGKSKDYVDQTIRLLDIPEEIQNRISKQGSGPSGMDEGKLSRYHIAEAQRGIDDVYISRQILEKAADEGLTVAQTRRIAETVKAAPSDQAKKKVLEWEYSPTLHDPERIRARAKKYGAHDVLYRNKKPKDQEWKNTPEVIAIIDNLKEMEGSIKTFNNTVEAGKLSPEAHDFIARKSRRVAGLLVKFAERLEEKDEQKN